MSEKQPHTLTPVQQHNTAQRIIHDSELLNDGAVIDHLGRLSITEGQYDALHALAPGASEAEQNPIAEVDPEPPTAETKEMTAERLKQIIDCSVYVAAPYVAGYELVKYNAIGPTNTDNPVMDSMYKPWPSQGIEKPFIERGVSELVTIAEGSQVKLRNGPIAGPWFKKGSHPGEPIHVVQYMTLTAGDGGEQKYEYRENKDAHWKKMSDEEVAGLSDTQKAYRERILQQPDRGRLSEFNYTMLLPETLAKELGEAMRANPQLARELGDMLVRNPDGVRQELSHIDVQWDDWKPPYDKWREINGGVNRIAFRDSDQQSVDDAEIVEF